MIYELPCTNQVVRKRCDLNAVGSNDRKTGESVGFYRRVEEIPNSFQRFTPPQTLNIATDPKLLFNTGSQIVFPRKYSNVLFFGSRPSFQGVVRCLQYNFERVSQAIFRLRLQRRQKPANSHS
jgi:hypothetical protein